MSSAVTRRAAATRGAKTILDIPTDLPSANGNVKSNGNGFHFDSKSTDRRTPSSRRTFGSQSPLATYSLLALYLPCLAFLASHRLYHLPAPVDNRNATSEESLLQFSEARAREHIHHLASTIGGRMVGSVGERWAEEYVVSRLNGLADGVPDDGTGVTWEVQVDRPSGSHTVPMAGTNVHKHFMNISNVIARISPPSYKGERTSILLNAHTDTAIGTTGAGDDAAGVSILLEVARILLHDKEFRKNLKNPIIFLFNGAEESFYDGSYGFMRSHPYANTVKAVINLEACGQGGPEALFQANSPEMVRSYARGAKWPHGSVMANDVFRTGILVSDTDFQQFVGYGHDDLVALDMAYYQNSHVYHTMFDTEDRLEPGSVQHFGDNVLGVTKVLATESELHGYRRGYDTVYMDVLGFCEVVFSIRTMRIIHVALLVLSVVLIISITYNRQGGQASTPLTILTLVLSLLLALPLSILGSFLSVSILHIAGGNLLTWFRTGPVGLLGMYGWGALAGLVGSQWIALAVLERVRSGRWTSVPSGLGEAHSGAMEHLSMVAQLVLFTFLLAIGTYVGLGSTILFALRVTCLMIAIWFATPKSPKPPKKYDSKLSFTSTQDTRTENLPLMSYAIIWTIPFLIDVHSLLQAFAIFLPLMGRAGTTTPAEYVAGGALVGMSVWLAMLPITGLVYRFRNVHSAEHIAKCVGVLMLLAIVVPPLVSVFTFPFDSHMHPKHLVVLLSENVTSDEHSSSLPQKWVSVGRMDSERRAFDIALDALEERIWWARSRGREMNEPHEHGSNVNVIYPLGNFVEMVSYPYDAFKAVVPKNASRLLQGQESTRPTPSILSESTYILTTHSRHITLRLEQGGMGWSSLSFTADLVRWSLDSNPNTGREQLHVVKNANGYNISTWALDLEIRCPKNTDPVACTESRITAELWGFDNRMWNVVGQKEDWGVYGDTDWFHVGNVTWEEGEVLRVIRRAMPGWVTLSIGSAVGGAWMI
ncbi:hypothetical protein M427DRAFT_69773 [Gonapodya prolifera JEL478]|uniref:Peptide hydrolase n=1 Tax=Gonapodya prolifera (strain JEL478) TaxID=1344416 RepID=A0A139AHG8_GONPJ|nr:hypothetical protein M427DRAFT_69773 [Gonapodya prolifera JEL478]|eukprot:KXS15885.1 hypothetical protein M427DRAFT_69773 [Gonapodya prolifera JEL478]